MICRSNPYDPKEGMMDKQQLKGLVAMVAKDESALGRLDPHQRELVEAYNFGKEDGSDSAPWWFAAGAVFCILVTLAVIYIVSG
jgi:hypothetical protein